MSDSKRYKKPIIWKLVISEGMCSNLDWSFEVLSLNSSFKDSESSLTLEAFATLNQTNELCQG
jgi:hypothetical protein